MGAERIEVIAEAMHDYLQASLRSGEDMDRTPGEEAGFIHDALCRFEDERAPASATAAVRALTSGGNVGQALEDAFAVFRGASSVSSAEEGTDG